MAAGFLRPSPGEAEKLKQEEQKKQKVQRLQQIREQEKRIAAERRRRYRAAAGTEWGDTIDQLEEKWALQRDALLGSLTDLERRHVRAAGTAHHDASSFLMAERKALEHLRATAAARQEQEMQRGAEARIERDHETTARLAPTIRKRAILEQTRKKENERAVQLAQLYRERKAASAPDVEIPSMPVPRTLLSSRTFESFDKTCLHRDFAATRCDPTARRTDAWTQADKVVKMRIENEVFHRDREHLLKQKAAERYKEAVRGIHMEERKKSLLKALDVLYDQDRKRKSRATVSDINHPNIYAMETRFSELFDLDT
ncbi:uncharacterized protein SPPG_01220 [Spizellomyces punctatus DAOM BR117]|uniref:Uncharacterized protein n=1 Tax=Spizellomyces punctatus (strain DAOM BR117) TaxID=645134 RepID=A0A0L0HSD6_SPIPD|nr:uncharacterized protein SPPG_01220 [Spizellomyces punctatus DAOM BR117]KND03764.1 hypothetical protein SPPG_01220 [Spizellomyces punctatus DAOM BR117]|eukprot:XP_016611803.1 hypothetical protein SPPG_01220 [Spizellomyces punctatus DAOM BR117]